MGYQMDWGVNQCSREMGAGQKTFEGAREFVHAVPRVWGMRSRLSPDGEMTR
jgi:hypothetical protein